MNHYDTLGVARGATPDEIRAAYRRAARASHPDRHGDASANQMAAVNEAWRVLGDPVCRQRYDLEVADADADRSSTGSAARSAPSKARDQQSPMPMPMPTGDLSRFPWRLFAILLVVGVVVVFVGNTLTDAPPPPPIDNLLLPGECVAFGELADEIVPIACDGSHDAVFLAVVAEPAECPIGTDGQRRDPLGRGRACLDIVESPGG